MYLQCHIFFVSTALADLCISSRLQIHPVLSDPTATVSFSIQRGIWILN